MHGRDGGGAGDGADGTPKRQANHSRNAAASSGQLGTELGPLGTHRNLSPALPSGLCPSPLVEDGVGEEQHPGAECARTFRSF